MRRWFATLLVTVMVMAAGALALLTTSPVSAADDEVVSADRAVTAAFEKGDKATINKWVDPEFTWIDTDGVMWPLREALESRVKPLVPANGDVKVVEHKYGNVVWVQDNLGKDYAAHTWVKRDKGGWKLLQTSEVSVHGRDYSAVRPNYPVPCINPCEFVPYKPQTENERASLAAWMEQESGKPGMWAKHIADNYDQRAVSTYGGPRAPKSQMVAQIAKAQEQAAAKHEPEVATVPFLWSRWWDFGTAVVMISVQPTYGERAYWASRVFAPLNGTWMMMESYHIYIDASPVMTAVPLDQSKDPKGLKMTSQNGGN
jgi:hypothetical protein